MDAEQKLAEICRKTRERNKRYYEANKERLNKKRIEKYRSDPLCKEKHKEACRRYYAKKKAEKEEEREME